jgi:predicted nucleic acid-binding protein
LSSDPAEKPATLPAYRKIPQRRPEERLPFLTEKDPPPEDLLFDTTVYVDTLQGKLPDPLGIRIAAHNPWHSTVVESELLYLCGRLEPRHPGTQTAIQQILAVVDRWPPERILNPVRAVWREAAILTGAIARFHRVKTEDRGRLMNDALIFLSAREHGATVLTRNHRDFDLLVQLVPEGRAVFYRTKDIR